MNYGEMLLHRNRPGDREKAGALLAQALEAAREMGMVKAVEDCEKLLGSRVGSRGWRRLSADRRLKWPQNGHY